jgi:hypothetical protein
MERILDCVVQLQVKGGRKFLRGSDNGRIPLNVGRQHTMDDLDGNNWPSKLIVRIEECPRKMSMQYGAIKLGLSSHCRKGQQGKSHWKACCTAAWLSHCYLNLPSLAGELVLHSKVRQTISRKFLSIHNQRQAVPKRLTSVVAVMVGTTFNSNLHQISVRKMTVS